VSDTERELSSNQRLLLDTVAKSKQLIALRQKQIELHEEMQRMFTIAFVCDVDPKEIQSAGYCPPTRGEYNKWPREAKLLLPFSTSLSFKDAHNYEGKCVVNRVSLRDGTKLELKTPVFLGEWENPEGLPGEPKPRPERKKRRLGGWAGEIRGAYGT